MPYTNGISPREREIEYPKTLFTVRSRPWPLAVLLRELQARSGSLRHRGCQWNYIVFIFKKKDESPGVGHSTARLIIYIYYITQFALLINTKNIIRSHRAGIDPLTVAFINVQGVEYQIESIQLLLLRSHPRSQLSPRLARALENRRGGGVHAHSSFN